MKRGAYLVNTARGKICDRDAVARALESGQLAGYAGDVWFPQPAPQDHPWRTMPHHGMTPHTSGTSLSAQARYAAGTREILECWFDGRPIREEYLIVDGGKLAGARRALVQRRATRRAAPRRPPASSPASPASLTGGGLPPGRARLRPPPRAAPHPPASGPCGPTRSARTGTSDASGNREAQLKRGARRGRTSASERPPSGACLPRLLGISHAQRRSGRSAFPRMLALQVAEPGRRR